MKRHVPVVWLLIILSAASLWYLFQGRSWLETGLTGKLPAWMESLLQTLYPRWTVERLRLKPAFFLRKADQLLVRSWLLSLTGIGLWVFLKEPYLHKWAIWWNTPVARSKLSMLERVFFILLCLYSLDFWTYLPAPHPLSAFYRPVSFLSTLHLPLPSPLFSYGWCALLTGSCIGSVIGFRPVWCAGLAACCFVCIQAWLYSFEKIDHTYVPLTYAALLMPLFAWQLRQGEGPLVSGWVLRLVRLSIAWVYFQSGLEKLLISGWEWFEPHTLIHHLQMHPTVLGYWVAQQEWLCGLLLWVVMAFEVGFPLILFFPGLRWVILGMGIGFHWGTLLLMDIGGWLSPWIASYLFFTWPVTKSL
jgi:uncharacterized membrane protein YphA (DoxX/SURF4 family)